MKHLYLAAFGLFSLFATSSVMAQNYQYIKVTTEPADWSGTYLIVHENDVENTAEVFDGSLEELDVVNNYFMADCNYKEVEGNSVRVIESNAQTDAATWTVTRGTEEGIYYLQSASGYWIGFNSTTEPIEPNLKSDNTKTYDNHIAMEEGKTNVVVTSKNGFELRWNNDKLRFRYHEAGKKKAIKFYAKTEVSTSAIETVEATSAAHVGYSLQGFAASGKHGLLVEDGRLTFRK